MTHCVHDMIDPVQKRKLDIPPFDLHQMPMMYNFPTKEIKNPA